MLARNEWDPLTKVIVGTATGARIPVMDKSLRCVNYADKKDVDHIPEGLYPQQVIDEANEDLDAFVNLLQGEGVEVLRPENNNPGYYNYCPRDTVFVHKDLILATPQPLRARHNEYLSMDYAFKSYKQQGYRYVAHMARKDEELYNENCVGDKSILALTEVEPCFDAANIIRANDDVYYLVSNSGNKAGALYLQSLLGTDTRVHLVEDVYSYMHIDSTISFLREGLMLLNPSRIKRVDQLPKSLRNWDIIWADDPVDIGYYPGYCNASTWVNVNLFSISPSLCVLVEGQDALRKQIESKGIDVAVLPMRHARTLGGCFHCVTLDLERRH